MLLRQIIVRKLIVRKHRIELEFLQVVGDQIERAFHVKHIKFDKRMNSLLEI